MKHFHLILMASVLLAFCTGCEKDKDVSEASPFSGNYNPLYHIQQIDYDIEETGVEIGGTVSHSLTSLWHWTGNMLEQVDYNYDSQLSYDIQQSIDRYWYTNARIDSLKYYYPYSNKHRTYHFHYQHDRLTCIDYWINNQRYSTNYIYEHNSQYPSHIVYCRPAILHTEQDSVRMDWTLEWKNGNLLRATADSVAWYNTGIAKIEYAYDNKVNPFQNFFTGNSLQNYCDILESPYSYCRNNMVQQTKYYKYHDDIETVTTHYNYQYDNRNRPTSVTYSYETMFYTTVTVTAHITY